MSMTSQSHAPRLERSQQMLCWQLTALLAEYEQVEKFGGSSYRSEHEKEQRPTLIELRVRDGLNPV